MDNVFPKRKWMRLRNYDYASQKVYFITLCTQNRERILSEIVGRLIIRFLNVTFLTVLVIRIVFFILIVLAVTL